MGRALQAGLKRGIDIVASALALTALSPGLLLVALLVRLKLGAPVLFTQPRLGRGGRTFTIYKFRSMTDACDEAGRLLPDDQRMTPFGAFLRSTSIDELPELANVLRGDMSLVGPRPLITWYLERYSPEQARRMEVRPGVTGLAQVEGRNALSWEERFRLDVHYVDHWNVLADLGIILRTVGTVLRRSGISAEGHATMPAFTGEGARRDAAPEAGAAARPPDPAGVPQRRDDPEARRAAGTRSREEQHGHP